MRMAELYQTLTDRLSPLLRRADVAGCEQLVLEQLAALPESPFHNAAELVFTVHPKAIAADFDGFFARQSRRFEVAALYTEMNAFQVNTRDWYYDKFAYRAYGGLESDDWLSKWDGESQSSRLVGMYKLQRVYASGVGQEPAHSDAFMVAGLLVLVRFWQLLSEAAALMRKVRVPLLGSAHDMGLCLELRPNAS
jgi:hypothetical protein